MTPSPSPRRIGALRVLWPATSGQRGRLAVIAALALLGGLAEAVVLVTVARLAVALAAGDDGFTVSLGPLGELDVAIGAALGVASALVLLRVVALVVAEPGRGRCTSGGSPPHFEGLLAPTRPEASWSRGSAGGDGGLRQDSGCVVATEPWTDGL